MCKRFFIAFISLFFLVVPVQASFITGEVEYSVTQARNDVFQDSSIRFDFNMIKENLFDKNYRDNIVSLFQGQTSLNDRTLAQFSDGSYAVIYNDKPKEVFYYSIDGILTHTELKDGLVYPYKTIKYSTNGERVNRTLRLSEGETFIFNDSGKLLAHWVGRNCYDENNNIVMTRQIYK